MSWRCLLTGIHDFQRVARVGDQQLWKCSRCESSTWTHWLNGIEYR